LPSKPSLRPADRLLKITRDNRGVGANGLEATPHDPLRLVPPHRREVAVLRVPIRKIFVPIAHDLVRAATVDDARQATHLLDKVTEGRGRRRPKLHVIDVAIEGLHQSVDKFCHAANLQTETPGRDYFPVLSFVVLPHTLAICPAHQDLDLNYHEG